MLYTSSVCQLLKVGGRDNSDEAIQWFRKNFLPFIELDDRVMYYIKEENK